MISTLKSLICAKRADKPNIPLGLLPKISMPEPTNFKTFGSDSLNSLKKKTSITNNSSKPLFPIYNHHDIVSKLLHIPLPAPGLIYFWLILLMLASLHLLICFYIFSILLHVCLLSSSQLLISSSSAPFMSPLFLTTLHLLHLAPYLCHLSSSLPHNCSLA